MPREKKDKTPSTPATEPPQPEVKEKPQVISLPTIACPSCRGTNLNHYGTARHPMGKRRYYTCLACGRNFHVIVTTEPISKRN